MGTEPSSPSRLRSQEEGRVGGARKTIATEERGGGHGTRTASLARPPARAPSSVFCESARRTKEEKATFGLPRRRRREAAREAKDTVLARLLTARRRHRRAREGRKEGRPRVTQDKKKKEKKKEPDTPEEREEKRGQRAKKRNPR